VRVSVDAPPVADAAEVCDLVIEVSDTGVGIAREDQERIFSPFEQASERSRSGAQGSGLGLSITGKLVELMHGTIKVDSSPGQGSIFTIRLPRVQVTQQSIDPPTERKADFNRLRPSTVLIVDDNATNRELLAGYLHGTHHQLLFAQDGVEAVELARAAQPDVILMDIRMPRMDGKWALKLLREDERTRDIAVIAQTASSMPEEASQLRKMFDGYLAKPFHQRQLFTQLAPVLGLLDRPEEAPTVVIRRPPKAQPAAETVVSEAEEIRSWPELAPVLAKWNEQDVPRFLRTLPMLEIAQFSRQVQSAAARHQCPPLRQWGQRLQEASESFELTEVENLLKGFDELTARLHSPAPDAEITAR
jgi:CheY-like chemotaxis protein